MTILTISFVLIAEREHSRKAAVLPNWKHFRPFMNVYANPYAKLLIVIFYGQHRFECCEILVWQLVSCDCKTEPAMLKEVTTKHA